MLLQTILSSLLKSSWHKISLSISIYTEKLLIRVTERVALSENLTCDGDID